MANPKKTFLPQRSLLFDPMYTWQYLLLCTLLFVSHAFLYSAGWAPPLGPGKGLVPENPLFKTYLLSSVAVILLTFFMAFVGVYFMIANNSASRSPEDYNTGDTRKPPKTIAEDADQARASRIHGNLLENVPLAVLLSTVMMCCNPHPTAAAVFMWGFVAFRVAHALWYWFAGSHEVRAMLYTFGIWCNLGCMFQIVGYALAL